jgi:hypothetical protein
MMRSWTEHRMHGSGRTDRRRMAVCLLFLGVMAAGCGDDTTGPRYGTLSGVVLDATGAPVPGAFVNFGYTVTVDQDTVTVPPASVTLAALTSLPLTLSYDADSVVVVFSDHLGRRVRRLVFGASPPIEAFWDGRDDAGRPVPDGPYDTVLSAFQDGDEVYHSESWTILIRESERETVAKVTTDHRGEFRMPLYELPIWEPYLILISYDSGSVDTSRVVFGRDVAAYAYRGDGTTTHARLPLTLDDPGESRSVELQLPD